MVFSFLYFSEFRTPFLGQLRGHILLISFIYFDILTVFNVRFCLHLKTSNRMSQAREYLSKNSCFLPWEWLPYLLYWNILLTSILLVYYYWRESTLLYIIPFDVCQTLYVARLIRFGLNWIFHIVPSGIITYLNKSLQFSYICNI